MVTSFAPALRSCRAGVTITFLLLGSYGAMLAAQVPATGAPAEDSVRAVEIARGQALLNADTVALYQMVAAEFVEISRLGTRRTRADNNR
jgi:hypothetical protein